MGRPGVLQKPELPDAQHRKLNDALHRLHLLAGRPSLAVMARELRDADISKSTIHNAFSSSRFPKWEVVDALIEILASRAPGLTPEQQLRPIYDCWVQAAEADGLPIAQPLRRLVLLADIVQFSRHDDMKQADLRRRLYDFVDRLMATAEVDAGQRHRADRGDSVMELIDNSTALAPILRALLGQAPVYLRDENRRWHGTRPATRLRIVLATAHVTIDNHNSWIGAELNAACRLLDGQALRDAMRKSDDDVALCLSDPAYQEAVQTNRGGVSPADFRTSFEQVAVETKNGSVPAWLAKFL
ncbi:hypothetical protein SRB5_52950 [Streptomyces sp. RB5]|uniref:Uncharacterized protein n=1 Tax=Streptomyces smaragdinus TaxID=2585196 RepID=A0A7K0CNQ1_9ACTN|nr:hypothetical protein [Streptomyces smaragdinus]MQY15117.1 hypothetical protein [Streptomyces smaragdinus]